jgi:hypothetical protein
MSSPWRPPGLPALSLLQIDLEIDHAALVQTAERWSPCYRIIASEYAGDNLFDRLVEDRPYAEQVDETEALRDIADLTNPHVLAEMGLIELVIPQDRAYGRGSGLIMAAFADAGATSRFSDGTAGTYYAARDMDTAPGQRAMRDGEDADRGGSGWNVPRCTRTTSCAREHA